MPITSAVAAVAAVVVASNAHRPEADSPAPKEAVVAASSVKVREFKVARPSKARAEAEGHVRKVKDRSNRRRNRANKGSKASRVNVHNSHRDSKAKANPVPEGRAEDSASSHRKRKDSRDRKASKANRDSRASMAASPGNSSRASNVRSRNARLKTVRLRNVHLSSSARNNNSGRRSRRMAIVVVAVSNRPSRISSAGQLLIVQFTGS